MGAGWVPVRDAVAAGTLRANDKLAPDVAARFDALLRYVALRLGRQLGTEVTPVLSRKDAADPAGRTQGLVASLASTGAMTGAIRVPSTVGPLNITVDLRSGRVTCHTDVEAPKQGRPATRVNWLIRQLKNAPDGLRVEAYAAFARGASTAELLKDVRNDPAVLVGDASKEIKTFRLAQTTALGPKRGRGRGGAIDSVLDAVDSFYGDVLSQLKAWTATPPKLRDDVTPAPVDVEEELVSTSLSSQDGPIPTTDEPAPISQEAPDVGSDAAEALAVEDGDDEAPPSWAQTTEPAAIEILPPPEAPAEASQPDAGTQESDEPEAWQRVGE
jgi:hypothetical protein